MTAVSPRLPLNRLRGIANPLARAGRWVVARIERREQMPRPPAYIVLCATVGVLNVVGLVMILSASSVAALSDYGSSWHFFNRQLLWAMVGLAMFILASRIDYRHWRRRGAHRSGLGRFIRRRGPVEGADRVAIKGIRQHSVVGVGGRGHRGERCIAAIAIHAIARDARPGVGGGSPANENLGGHRRSDDDACWN